MNRAGRLPLPRSVWLLGLVALLLVLAPALSLVGLLGSGTASRPAPAVSLSLSDGSRLEVGSMSQRGVVVLNFFASWCPPCRDEAPALRTAWGVMEDDGDVVMVGVVFDDTAASAQSFLDDYGLTYPLAGDPAGEVADAFRVRGIPRTFVIAPGGEIVLSHFGAVRTDQLLGAIEEARLRGR